MPTMLTASSLSLRWWLCSHWLVHRQLLCLCYFIKKKHFNINKKYIYFLLIKKWHSSICLFLVPDRVNVLSQYSQSNGFFFSCEFMWFFKSPLRVNSILHTAHLKGLMPANIICHWLNSKQIIFHLWTILTSIVISTGLPGWTFKWLASPSDLKKVFSQRWQVYLLTLGSACPVVVRLLTDTPESVGLILAHPALMVCQELAGVLPFYLIQWSSGFTLDLSCYLEAKARADNLGSMIKERIVQYSKTSQ